MNNESPKVIILKDENKKKGKLKKVRKLQSIKERQEFQVKAIAFRHSRKINSDKGESGDTMVSWRHKHVDGMERKQQMCGNRDVSLDTLSRQSGSLTFFASCNVRHFQNLVVDSLNTCR